MHSVNEQNEQTYEWKYYTSENKITWFMDEITVYVKMWMWWHIWWFL